MSDLSFPPPGDANKKPAAKPGRKPNDTPKAKDKSLASLRRAVREAVDGLKTKTVLDMLDTTRRVMIEYDFQWYITEDNQAPVVLGSGNGLMWRFNIEIVGTDAGTQGSFPITAITPPDMVSPMTARLHAELTFIQSFFALYRDFDQILNAAMAAQAQQPPTVEHVKQPKPPTNTVNHPNKTHTTGFPDKMVAEIVDHVQPDGVPIFRSPYDSTHDSATTTGVISAVIDQFIATVQTSSALQHFGEQNKEVFDYLKDFNRQQHDEIMGKLNAKWGELTAN